MRRLVYIFSLKYAGFCIRIDELFVKKRWISEGKCEDLFKIYPLLLYPCKLVDRGGMVRIPAGAGAGAGAGAAAGAGAGAGAAAGAAPPSAMALNLGVYGIPVRCFTKMMDFQ